MHVLKTLMSASRPTPLGHDTNAKIAQQVQEEAALRLARRATRIRPLRSWERAPVPVPVPFGRVAADGGKGSELGYGTSYMLTETDKVRQLVRIWMGAGGRI